LHSALDQILREKKVINDYVTDFSECSSYDIFEPESDPTIEDAEERLPNEIDNDESEDSDFELDSSEGESDGDGESSEEENDSEAATSKKENEPIIDPKKAKKRANREAQYQRIFSSSNPIKDQLMKYPQQLIMRRQLVKSQQQKTLSVIFAMENLQNKVLLGIEILARQKTKLLIIKAKLPKNLIF
jgi:hypothetical protein